MPLGGGTIKSVLVTRATDQRADSGDAARRSDLATQADPRRPQLTIYVVVKRPGPISWLTGSTERIHLTLTTPTASLRSHYLTLRSGAAVARCGSTRRCRWSPTGSPAPCTATCCPRRRRRRIFRARTAAGSELVAATPRGLGDRATEGDQLVPGRHARGQRGREPGTGNADRDQHPDHAHVLASRSARRSAVTCRRSGPNTPGTWHQVNDHTITFQPEGYGYGLGATVTVPLPGGVQLVGASRAARRPGGHVVGSRRDDAAPAAAALAARLPAAELQVRGRNRRRPDAGSAGAGGAASAGRDIHLAIREHALRAEVGLAAGSLRDRDQGRDHGVRERPGDDGRRRAPARPCGRR